MTEDETPQSPDLPLSDAQRAELLRRSKAYRRNPERAIPLDEALDRIERSLGEDQARPGVRYTAVVQRSGEWWSGWIEEVPGVNSQGATREELVENLTSALEEALGTSLLSEPSFSVDWSREQEDAAWEHLQNDG